MEANILVEPAICGQHPARVNGHPAAKRRRFPGGVARAATDR